MRLSVEIFILNSFLPCFGSRYLNRTFPHRNIFHLKILHIISSHQHIFEFERICQMLIVSTEMISGGRTPLLRGSVCAYHPATQGLNPKHNITLLQFIFEL